jgi:hypothetical protein
MSENNESLGKCPACGYAGWLKSRTAANVCARCGYRPAGMPVADIVVIGPVNGMGEADIRGSYVGMSVAIGHSQHEVRISVGGARDLAQSLNGLLLDRHLGARTLQRIPDIDRFVGTIIDAYTLAPNGEDERRDAVRACVERSGWRP